MWNIKVKGLLDVFLVLVLAGFVYKTCFSEEIQAQSRSQQGKTKGQVNDREVLKKMKALNDLHEVGLLSDAEYGSKTRQLLNQGKPSAAPDEEADNDDKEEEVNSLRRYTAPDGSFSCILPAGWKANVSNVQGVEVKVLEPPNSGGQRSMQIIKGTHTTGVRIEDLARDVFSSVLKDYPGADSEGKGQQRFFKVGFGGDATDLSYVARHPDTGADVRMRIGVLYQGLTHYVTIAMTDPAHADAFLEQAMAVFQSLRPGSASEYGESGRSVFQTSRPGSASNNARQTGDRSFAAALVGTWSYYHGSGTTSGRGSVSKNI